MLICSPYLCWCADNDELSCLISLISTFLSNCSLFPMYHVYFKLCHTFWRMNYKLSCKKLSITLINLILQRHSTVSKEFCQMFYLKYCKNKMRNCNQGKGKECGDALKLRRKNPNHVGIQYLPYSTIWVCAKCTVCESAVAEVVTEKLSGNSTQSFYPWCPCTSLNETI